MQNTIPELNGEISASNEYRLIYSTDASAYREKPAMVVWPADKDDIQKLIPFARKTSQTLIPRGAGTSLAGQVVGKGIIVDLSRHFNKILEINTEEKWVRVQPGVVLDELNQELMSHELFFAPETSTSNRCVIGGMIGNNSSGLHSLIYGTTREHIISVKAILSDGSEAEFGPMQKQEFLEKTKEDSLEGLIYRQIKELLENRENRSKIRSEYPESSIIRRNTGYALDELMECSIFQEVSDQPFNFSKIICGSEGTLAFITEAKLKLSPLPQGPKALIAAHFNSVKDAIKANLVALKYNPGAIELMDNRILELTRKNIEQRKNRFFIQGDPGAILMIEVQRKSLAEIREIASAMENEMRSQGLGYYFPVIYGDDIKKVWTLRKAGLGVLSNMPGDAKPVSVIEDTSVNPALLEDYIEEFNDLLKKYNLECVYHAHISVGQLHLRPILNLKKKKDVELFYSIAKETARLVKKYKGSLSGEHGDGRLRGEFIPLLFGREIYNWFREIKKTWDPDALFNFGKITDTPPMNSSLRYIPGQKIPDIPTILDFSAQGGILRAAEKCNGSGDCRKTEKIGGTMCPSYMATRDEYTTTRARANLLREYLGLANQTDPFNHKELYDILDLCLSCKGCKSECPSSVDMAKLKAEFLQHYYDNNGIPLRTRLIAYITLINKLGSVFPDVFNFFIRNKIISGVLKKILGFAKERSFPSLNKITLRRWGKQNMESLNSRLPLKARLIHIFIDEFTNFNDVETGVKAVRLLNGLGYRVSFPRSTESGRSFISKGFLRTARKKAIKNIENLRGIVNYESPLVGIEPSAILSFRDEYPELVRGKLKKEAIKLAENTLTIEEFLMLEIKSGKIKKENFTKEEKIIWFHGHCQQKAVASTEPSRIIMSFPENYKVKEIPSGCCGMAGSFGYEKEHYDLSMKIGEMVLFPEIRKIPEKDIIAAPGTSCRHQIKDGTGRIALHPVEVLYEALIRKE